MMSPSRCLDALHIGGSSLENGDMLTYVQELSAEAFFVVQLGR